MQELINKVQELIFLIREYGFTEYFKKHPQVNTVENEKEFIALTNEGMKKAQQIILAELQLNVKLQNDAKSKLKAQRQINNKDKATIALIQEEVKKLEFFEIIYRNLMNSLVWMIFGGKREIIARYCLEEGGTKSLEGQGFEAVVSAAQIINRDPLKFALIADLPTNMQVGDLIVRTVKSLEIVEVKTGNKNKSALDLLKFYDVNGLNPEDKVEQMEDGHFKNQLKRMLKQKATNRKTADIINNDSGVYQKDDKVTIKLSKSIYQETTYHNILFNLIEKSKEKNWAYESIEGIVNVGVYRNNWRKVGKRFLEDINKYPVFDLRTTLNTAVCEPIFMKPFPTDVLTDIAFGKIMVFIGIDYDKLIEFANDIGLPLRWSTAKELNEMKQSFPLETKEIFSHNNKGLIIGDGERQTFIGMGFIVRILFDHNTPIVQLFNRLETFKSI